MDIMDACFLLAFSCVLTACTPRRETASSDSSSNPLKGAEASGDTRSKRCDDAISVLRFPPADCRGFDPADDGRSGGHGQPFVRADAGGHDHDPECRSVRSATAVRWNSGCRCLTSFLREGTGPKRVVTMMDCVDVVQEEIVEGMEDGEAHDHGHTHVHADGTVHG